MPQLCPLCRIPCIHSLPIELLHCITAFVSPVDLISTCLVLGPLCGAVSPAEGVSSLLLHAVFAALHPAHKRKGEGAPEALLRVAQRIHDIFVWKPARTVGRRPENGTDAARSCLQAVLDCLVGSFYVTRRFRDDTMITLCSSAFRRWFPEHISYPSAVYQCGVLAAAVALESWKVVDDALDMEKSNEGRRSVLRSVLDGNSLIWWVVRSGDRGRIRKAVQFAQDIDDEELHECRAGRRGHILTNALEAACDVGDIEVARKIFHNNEFAPCFDVRRCWSDEHHSWTRFAGVTRQRCDALSIACLRGHSDIVKLILELRIITVNGQEKASLAPLVAACLGGHEGIASFLLERGADVMAHHAALPIGLALHAACAGGRISLIQMLLHHLRREPSSDRFLEILWQFVFRQTEPGVALEMARLLFPRFPLGRQNWRFVACELAKSDKELSARIAEFFKDNGVLERHYQ